MQKNFYSKEKMLNVAFLFNTLQKNSFIIDPADLSTTPEYYLLENLAVGLVRDDPTDPRTYRPVLATSWKQVDEKTWSFHLRDGLQWSDGTPITEEHIIANFKRFQTSHTRHLFYLKKLRSIEFDRSTRRLNLTFKVTTNSGLLHELSLADATILHPHNLTIGWEVTSGPYSVRSYDAQKRELILVKNNKCPLVEDGAPEIVRLFDLDKKDWSKAFGEIPVDVMTAPLLRYRQETATLEQKAPSVVRGYPTYIYFFGFNDTHPDAQREEVRREFASLVQMVFESAELPPGLKYENQFIPLGFEGRLEDYRTREIPIKVLRGKSLVLSGHAFFKNIPFLDRLAETASRYGVTIRYHFYENSREANDLSDHEKVFATFGVFKGNQRDAAGSWRFLFSDKLSTFYKNAEIFFDRIQTADEGTRKTLLEQLHREVLQKTYGVPFLNEAEAYYMNADLDVSRWNSFDMRMRLYDVRWKN